GWGLGAECDAVFDDLWASYQEVARGSPAYARWLSAQQNPGLPVVA
ncbi:LysR family transcriptional regulator, partial [Streptomyces oryzae]|nr:LysR family transcriptional regulator [Streptomyces oryzae]